MKKDLYIHDNSIILARITVYHSFFEHGICPSLKICLSPESQSLLYRREILFKRIDDRQWVVFGFNRDIRFEDKDVLRFDVIYTDPRFFLYTQEKKSDKQEEEPNRDHRIVFSDHIPLTAELVNTPKDIQIAFQAKKVYWKYILIPRGGKVKKLELSEISGKLIFIKEETETPGIENAQSFISRSSIMMKESYDYDIRLYEENNYGKKLLKQFIEFPKMENYSKDHDKRILIRYIYY